MPENGGERITYSTKELLNKIETTLGDKIDRLTETVDRITTLHEAELRDVRHRVANLEAAGPLRARLDLENENARNDLRSLAKEVENLKTDSASQHAVDQFKKYLVGTIILGFGSLAVAVLTLLLALP